jgi:class 3 adenylate cyclase
MGVHLGEIEGRGADVAGVAVHLASRVMAAGDAGDILTTAAVPLATLGGGFTFESCGRHRLKGFDDAFELFRLVV